MLPQYNDKVGLDRIAARHNDADRGAEGIAELLVFRRDGDIPPQAARNPLVEAAWRGRHVHYPVDDLIAVAIVGQLLPVDVAPLSLRRTRYYRRLSRNHKRCHGRFFL